MASTRKLRYAFGLAVLALGMLGAGSAQATPTWKVAGSNLTSGEKTLKGNAASESVALLTKILGAAVKFSCKKAELTGGALKPEGKLAEGAKVRFTECKTFINEKESPACEPKNGGTEKGVILTNGLKGELTEYKKEEGIVLVKSTVEEEIAKVKQPVFTRIKMSEECSLGENIPIIGSAIGLVDTGGLASLIHEATIHKFKEGPLTELWAVSKTEEHKATIDGEAEASLASSEEWSGMPLTLVGLKITPSRWTFLALNAEKSFMIKNETANEITDLDIKILATETDFKKSGTNCGLRLASMATCEVSVKCVALMKLAVLAVASAGQGALDVAGLES